MKHADMSEQLFEAEPLKVSPQARASNTGGGERNPSENGFRCVTVFGSSSMLSHNWRQ